jgi:hypothetical protein
MSTDTTGPVPLYVCTRYPLAVRKRGCVAAVRRCRLSGDHMDATVQSVWVAQHTTTSQRTKDPKRTTANRYLLEANIGCRTTTKLIPSWSPSSSACSCPKNPSHRPCCQSPARFQKKSTSGTGGGTAVDHHPPTTPTLTTCLRGARNTTQGNGSRNMRGLGRGYSDSPQYAPPGTGTAHGGTTAPCCGALRRTQKSRHRSR